jgi:hypothetical protein
MNEKKTRILTVIHGKVECVRGKREEIEKCRFCVHSKRFLIGTRWIDSPARAYCTVKRSTEEVDLALVTQVECGAKGDEGFRSIMNIIS